MSLQIWSNRRKDKFSILKCGVRLRFPIPYFHPHFICHVHNMCNIIIITITGKSPLFAVYTVYIEYVPYTILLVLIHSINIIIIITVIRRMFAYDVASTELLLRSLVKHIERHDFACYSIADVKIFLNKKQQCIHETWSEKKIRYTSKDFSALEQMTANRLEREWVGVASNKAEK